MGNMLSVFTGVPKGVLDPNGFYSDDAYLDIKYNHQDDYVDPDQFVDNRVTRPEGIQTEHNFNMQNDPGYRAMDQMYKEDLPLEDRTGLMMLGGMGPRTLAHYSTLPGSIAFRTKAAIAEKSLLPLVRMAKLKDVRSAFAGDKTAFDKAGSSIMGNLIKADHMFGDKLRERFK